MIETLHELREELWTKYKTHLFLMYGDIVQVLREIHESVQPIKVVGFNRDYTPYARKREGRIAAFCRSVGAECISAEDILLHPINDSRKPDGTPYRIFTPYKCHLDSLEKVRAVDNSPLPPWRNPTDDITKKMLRMCICDDRLEGMYTNSSTRLMRGGLKAAKEILLRDNSGYDKARDTLAMRTTLLSPYISFGVLSIREVYWHFVRVHGKDSLLVTQLQWREFYTAIQYFFPYVIRSNLKPFFDGMTWDNDPTMFKRWRDGMTGFPVVDAGMRQLQKEGFMANRARMITSSFLVKHLLIDWRYGERHFARHLTDIYFPSNNGGWQWTFGGVDPNWFRIFNPLRQGEKYDPECVYIKRYVPELRDVPVKHIHQWTKYHTKYDVGYPQPCVDLDKRRKLFFERVRSHHTKSLTKPKDLR